MLCPLHKNKCFFDLIESHFNKIDKKRKILNVHQKNISLQLYSTEM